METQGRLIVDVARLTPGGEWYRGECAPELLDLGESDLVTPVGGMRYDLKVELVARELLARGTVRQRVDYVCSRCADNFEAEVEEPEFFHSLELSAETDFVDLTDEVRETIILALSSYPVCDEACKGLCMACGANLNRVVCGCRRETGDTRWEALGGLEF